MLITRLQVLMATTLSVATVFAKGNACEKAWIKHQGEYTALIKKVSPKTLTQAQERLDKSVSGHEKWLKNVYSKIDSDVEVRIHLIGIKERTSQLKKSFETLTDEEKAILFSSKNRFEQLKSNAKKEDLFELSLKQEYFGIRSSKDEAEDIVKNNVYKYISVVEDMNWSLVNPVYKLLAPKTKSEKNDKVWSDENGLEMEANVNHFRNSGEFIVSICSRMDGKKDFKFLSEHETLPPQFACSQLNIKDGSIEKGLENREEIKSVEQMQAFLTERYFKNHNIQEKCTGKFTKETKKNSVVSL